ncbi:S-adenosyl-L-methionine-dependent methyltransferase [Aspergillus vadensis CBS 113365]|uniref:S-adenosyl-L-methionine-dependent methyltransferase n=1 Tax=Aspergillus vadensis (strain CBS 113365 / IMI 142717 / IBT 24658) TaxID=1448311 RepID=A0A319B103_ASPVC|nr:S-adenosyl-L-methionine-dependent methyltransferase [Aspergillus vadensis CBS 113365]PYH65805.1 S-adenosyl-L-methionine-dependent methyltransferase [Aspergillus vadensis CBS 113365]
MPGDIQSSALPPDQLDALAAQLTQAATCLRQNSNSSNGNGTNKENLGTAPAVGNAGIATALRNLMTPKEHFLDLMLIPAAMGVLRVFLHWGALERIPRDCITPISYTKLAEQLGAEVELVRRLAWTLVAAGFLKQVGTDQLVNTPNSVVLIDNPTMKGILDVVSQQVSAAMAFPKYFEHYGRVEPTQQRGSPWTFARGQPDKTIWEIMKEDPDEVEGFAKSMRNSSRFYPMPGPYDFSWIIDHPIEDKTRPLLVDIAGSDGEALLSILRNTPGLLPERCVLQDLPHVLDDVVVTRPEEEIKALKKVPLDFSKEEPVKGALVYHIRRTLHDYSDTDALNILRLISKAMAPDSRLLIVELIMNNPATPLAAAVDLFMCITAGKERTIEMFERLTADAGLRITRVVPGKTSEMGVLECMK